MATENEKGWEQVGPGGHHRGDEELHDSLSGAVSFPHWYLCILSKPGRVGSRWGKEGPKPESAFGLVLSSPSLGFSGPGFIPRLWKQETSVELIDS